MALDPRIALMGQPAQIRSPLENYQNVALLQSLLQQRQANQQTLQMNRMKMEQMQQEQRDQAAMKQAIIESGGSMERLFAALDSLGVSPEYKFKIQEQAYKAKSEFIKMSEAEKEQTLKTGTALAALFAPVDKELERQEASGAPDYRKAQQALIGAMSGAVQMGVLDEESAFGMLQQNGLLQGFDPAKYRLMRNPLSLGLDITAMEAQAKNVANPSQPTVFEQEFTRTFLPGFLAENGLERNEANIFKAYKEYKAQGGTSEAASPTSYREYQLALKDGSFKGNYNAWLTMDANRKKSNPSVVRISTVDEEGKPVIKFVSPQAGAEYEAAPTADMRNKEAVRNKTLDSITAVENLSKKVISKRGVAQRAQAVGRSIEAALGNDPEYRTYQDARTALAGNLAVLQQGSRPSDADIKAIWLPLVPDVFKDTDQSAAMKWELIKRMSGVPLESDSTATPTPTQATPTPGRIKILEVK